jgi:two-component system phosphate regulon sensor histidine kinase PhoR
VRKRRTSLGIVMVICVVTTFWSIAYWITTLFFSTLGEVSNEYVKQLVSVLLGLIIMATVGFIMGKLIRPRHRDGFRIIMEALRQIASGNFNVKVDLHKEHKDNPS